MFLRRSKWPSYYLNHSPLSCDLQDLTFPYAAVSQTNIDDLGVFGELDVVENNQGPIHLDDSSIVYPRSNVIVSGDRRGIGLERLLLLHERYYLFQLVASQLFIKIKGWFLTRIYNHWFIMLSNKALCSSSSSSSSPAILVVPALLTPP